MIGKIATFTIIQTIGGEARKILQLWKNLISNWINLSSKNGDNQILSSKKDRSSERSLIHFKGFVSKTLTISDLPSIAIPQHVAMSQERH